MTDEQWRKVWELYQSCASASAEQLQAELGRVDDEQVRQAVSAMIHRPTSVERLDRIGQKIGRYVLTANLGRGGMGEVYAGRDSELGRSVAVKLLAQPTGAESSPLARFLHEAKAASALNHPNIVTIYEVIHSESRAAIVMELIDGVSLRQLCGSPMPVDRVLHLGGQIARALAAAHTRGIIHCDIKPENLMVREDGIVKVLDFGLARNVMTGASTSALPAGTLRYMSPEYSRGEPVSAANDMFCLGLVLYELVTGVHPFDRSSIFETMKALNEAAPEAASARNPYVPPALDALILRLLDKDPEQRPGAAEVARLMAGQAPGPAVDPVPASRRQPLRPISLRWRSRLVLVAAAATTMLAAAGVVRWRTNWPAPEPVFEPVRLTTLPGSEDGPSFSPGGNQVAFRGDQNGQWDIYAKVIGGGPPLRLTSDAGTHWYPAWSPDGKWIAFTARHDNARDGLFLVPALGGPERLLAEFQGDWSTVDWSADGKWIAVSPSHGASFIPTGGITLVSTETGEQREFVQQNTQMAQGAFAHFSPDGRRLAFLQMRGTLGRLHVADLTADMRLAGLPRPAIPDEVEAQFPAWTADGREIVFMRGFSSSNGALVRVPAAGGAIRRIPGLQYTAGPVSIARTGRRMAFSTGGIDSDIWRVDTLGEEPARKIVVSSVSDLAGEYSPDGTRIVFSSNRSGSREIWVCDANGRNAEQLTHFGGPITGTARWSPDGRWIAFDSRPRGAPDIFVINSDGAGLRRIDPPSREEGNIPRWGMWQPAWSADGKWLYFSSDRSGRFEIWRIPWLGGRAEQVTRNGASSAHPSRDGQWIYYLNGEPGPLWRVRPHGGEAARIAPVVRLLQVASTASGTYFVDSAGDQSVLYRIDAGGNAVKVTGLPFTPGLGLSLSPDGRYALITQPDERGTDLVLVEGLH